jgi:hypothetical protein
MGVAHRDAAAFQQLEDLDEARERVRDLGAARLAAA